MSLDPKKLYRGSEAVGDLVGFDVQAVMAGQYAFRVLALQPIDKGDVLRFRHATCLVTELGQVVQTPTGRLMDFACRVISG